MRILLDESLPERFRFLLQGHDVATVRWMGWSCTKNGQLLDLAQVQFDVLLTADQNLPFQQNLSRWKIAVFVLAGPDNQFETLKPLASEVLAVLETIEPGQGMRIEVSV